MKVPAAYAPCYITYFKGLRFSGGKVHHLEIGTLNFSVYSETNWPGLEISLKFHENYMTPLSIAQKLFNQPSKKLTTSKNQL